MLETSSRGTKRSAANQCWNNYRIIQMFDSKNEVWYQIERHTQVAGSQSSKQLRGTWGAFILQHALINDQFALKQANNLFASLNRHTRHPLNPRQHPRKNSAKN